MPRRRRLPPPPKIDPDGTWIWIPNDTGTGGHEEFFTWSQIEQGCQYSIGDFEAGGTQYTADGDIIKKWKDDPTYFAKRKRK